MMKRDGTADKWLSAGPTVRFGPHDVLVSNNRAARRARQARFRRHRSPAFESDAQKRQRLDVAARETE
jgi:hypothetical protein